MNIDELKDAWNQDEPKGMHLPVSTAMFGKTTSAVAKLRRNMKRELIATLICYIIIIGAFSFGKSLTPFLFDIACVLLFTLLVLNCYYFIRFYIFYKSTSRYDFSIKENMRKVAYELELNTEIYKTYNMSATPIAVLISFSLAFSKIPSKYLEHLIAANTFVTFGRMLLIFSVILISFIATYFGVNWAVRLQYGKYLAELKQVVEDLGDEN